MPHSNITIIKAATKTLRLTVVDENGDPIDLTGGTIYWGMKAKITDSSLLIDKKSSTPSQITILTQSGATLGKADIFLVTGDTSGRAPGRYVYDCWVKLSSKPYNVIQAAEFIIEPAVVTSFS